jgi:hypothetical protein
MKKTAFISDLLFSFFSVFVFVTCLFRYLRFSLWLSVIFAVVAGVAVTFFVWAHLSKKRKLFFLKKAEEREKDLLLLHLAMLPFEKQAEIFKNASREENGKNTQKTYAKFLFNPLSASDLAEFFKREFSRTQAQTAPNENGETQEKNAVNKALPRPFTIYCNAADESAIKLCERFGVRLCGGEESYLLLKLKNALPERYFAETYFFKREKRKISFYFQKKNSRRFLVGGVLILCTSLFTPFPYYYLVSGSVLLLIAALVRILGKR